MSLESHAKLNLILSVTGALVVVAWLAFSLPPRFVSIAFIGITLMQLGSWLWLRRRARMLGERVVAADARLCVKCEYPLQQGETWLHCPECGHETDPNETWRDWHTRLAPHGHRVRLPWLFTNLKEPKPTITLRLLERLQIAGGVACVVALLGIVVGRATFGMLLILVIGFLLLVAATIWWKFHVHGVLSRLHQCQWNVCPECEIPLNDPRGRLECGSCGRQWGEGEVAREWERRMESWRLRDAHRIPPASTHDRKQ